MAYADLGTFLTGDVLTAADMNQTRDNFEFLIDPPACSVFNNTTQSLAHNTLTALTANSENYDNDSMHSTSVNTSRITIQTAGRYALSSIFSYAANATGSRNVSYRVNGTTAYPSQHLVASPGAVTTDITGIRTLVLAAGDYVETEGFQSSGGALDVTLKEFAAFFLTR